LGILGKEAGAGPDGGFPDRKKRIFESGTERLRRIGNGISPAVNFFEKLAKISGQDLTDKKQMGLLCH